MPQDYLDTKVCSSTIPPPQSDKADTAENSRLGTLLDMLGIEPQQLLRTKEEEYSRLKLADKLDDRDALIRAMVDHPVLMERPSVVRGDKARLGRPPEDVLEIL